MKSIGRELDPGQTEAVGRVSTVIAIKATKEPESSPTGDEAQRMLEAGHEIEEDKQNIYRQAKQNDHMRSE